MARSSSPAEGHSASMSAGEVSATAPPPPATSATATTLPAASATVTAPPAASPTATTPVAVSLPASALAASPLTPLDVVHPLIRVRQTRDFTGRRISRAELEAITEVARWTGSSRNEQPCRFIALRDHDLIRAIAELGLPQTRGLRTASAAVAIVLPDEPEREISRAFDDGRAAERMLIAAHLLGLRGGISRLRPDVREPIGALLRLPAQRSVRTIVAVGHPSAEGRLSNSKPGQARLPREETVYDGHWPSR